MRIWDNIGGRIKRMLGFIEPAALQPVPHKDAVKAHLEAGSIQVRKDQIVLTGGAPYIAATAKANGVPVPAEKIHSFQVLDQHSKKISEGFGKIPHIVLAILCDTSNQAQKQKNIWKNPDNDGISTLISNINEAKSREEKENKMIEICQQPEALKTLQAMLKSLNNPIIFIDDSPANCDAMEALQNAKVHVVKYNLKNPEGSNEDVQITLKGNPGASVYTDFDQTLTQKPCFNNGKQTVNPELNGFAKALSSRDVFVVSNNITAYTTPCDDATKTELFEIFPIQPHERNDNNLKAHLQAFNQARKKNMDFVAAVAHAKKIVGASPHEIISDDNPALQDLPPNPTDQTTINEWNAIFTFLTENKNRKDEKINTFKNNVRKFLNEKKIYTAEEKLLTIQTPPGKSKMTTLYATGEYLSSLKIQAQAATNQTATGPYPPLNTLARQQQQEPPPRPQHQSPTGDQGGLNTYRPSI